MNIKFNIFVSAIGQSEPQLCVGLNQGHFTVAKNVSLKSEINSISIYDETEA